MVLHSEDRGAATPAEEVSLYPPTEGMNAKRGYEAGLRAGFATSTASAPSARMPNEFVRGEYAGGELPRGVSSRGVGRYL